MTRRSNKRAELKETALKGKTFDQNGMIKKNSGKIKKNPEEFYQNYFGIAG